MFFSSCCINRIHIAFLAECSPTSRIWQSCSTNEKSEFLPEVELCIIIRISLKAEIKIRGSFLKNGKNTVVVYLIFAKLLVLLLHKLTILRCIKEPQKLKWVYFHLFYIALVVTFCFSGNVISYQFRLSFYKVGKICSITKLRPKHKKIFLNPEYFFLVIISYVQNLLSFVYFGDKPFQQLVAKILLTKISFIGLILATTLKRRLKIVDCAHLPSKIWNSKLFRIISM